MLIFAPLKGLAAWVRWPLLVGIIVALAATYSRMGWVLLVFGLVLLGWRERKGVVLAGIAVALIVVVTVPTIRERAVPFTVPQEKLEQSSAAGYESFDWRMDNWRGLLDEWEKKPLLGYGLQATTYVNPRRRLGAADRAEAQKGFDAHNMVVRILVEGGVVLLVCYIFFLAAILMTTRRLRRARWPLAEESRIIHTLWLLIILVAVATDDPMGHTTLMYVLLALTGALEGAYRHWMRHERDSPEEHSASAPPRSQGRRSLPEPARRVGRG